MSTDQQDLFAWADERCPAETPAAGSPSPRHARLKKGLWDLMRLERGAPVERTDQSFTARGQVLPDAVIDFHARREKLGRWLLHRDRWHLGQLDRDLDRALGLIPPAPIIPFPHRHPAYPGAYTPESSNGLRA